MKKRRYRRKSEKELIEALVRNAGADPRAEKLSRGLIKNKKLREALTDPSKIAQDQEGAIGEVGVGLQSDAEA